MRVACQRRASLLTCEQAYSFGVDYLGVRAGGAGEENTFLRPILLAAPPARKSWLHRQGTLGKQPNKWGCPQAPRVEILSFLVNEEYTRKLTAELTIVNPRTGSHFVSLVKDSCGKTKTEVSESNSSQEPVKSAANIAEVNYRWSKLKRVWTLANLSRVSRWRIQEKTTLTVTYSF